ncbi:hypothetical protein F5879DRAFT_995890 [Lentinula edodes]|nr:hypothetical protein F5879DRAFT_995890 [Lentinula edodes]
MSSMRPSRQVRAQGEAVSRKLLDGWLCDDLGETQVTEQYQNVAGLKTKDYAVSSSASAVTSKLGSVRSKEKRIKRDDPLLEVLQRLATLEQQQQAVMSRVAELNSTCTHILELLETMTISGSANRVELGPRYNDGSSEYELDPNEDSQLLVKVDNKRKHAEEDSDTEIQTLQIESFNTRLEKRWDREAAEYAEDLRAENGF